MDDEVFGRCPHCGFGFRTRDLGRSEGTPGAPRRPDRRCLFLCTNARGIEHYVGRRSTEIDCR